MQKPAALSLVLLLTLTPVLGQAEQDMGFKQEVSINVDRGNHGPVETTTLYCMQNNINYCERHTSLIDTGTVMLGISSWYQGFLETLPWTQKQEKQEVIMLGPSN